MKRVLFDTVGSSEVVNRNTVNISKLFSDPLYIAWLERWHSEALQDTVGLYIEQ
jgi:hypothetical protein